MFWRLWPGNGLKWKFSLKTISRLTRKDKERERESLRLRWSTNPRTDLRPRAFDPRAFDFASDPEPSCHEPIFDPKPLTHRSTNPRTDLQPRAFNPRAFDFASDLEPSRHKPMNRSLSLCDFDFLCDFDRPTNRSTFLCDFDFLLSLFDFWFFCCCCGGVGGGVLVVFLLCGGGFCVGGGGK